MTDSPGSAAAAVGSTAKYEAPQAFAREVPDVLSVDGQDEMSHVLTSPPVPRVPPELLPDFPRGTDQPLTADDAPYQVVAGDDAPRVFEEVLIAEDECIPVARIASDGAVTVNPDIPRGDFQVAVTSPLRWVLNNEDTAELARLEQRVQAEPTSFRAQQELQSFKSLKGIA